MSALYFIYLLYWCLYLVSPAELRLQFLRPITWRIFSITRCPRILALSEQTKLNIRSSFASNFKAILMISNKTTKISQFEPPIV